MKEKREADACTRALAGSIVRGRAFVSRALIH
jgi:hypothetical protein